MVIKTKTLFVVSLLLIACSAFVLADDASNDSMSMSFGDVIATVMTALFALAFAAWAKRLDKALDLLEKIQAQMHKQSLRTERRLTRLEQIAVSCGNGNMLSEDDDDD